MNDAELESLAEETTPDLCEQDYDTVRDYLPVVLRRVRDATLERAANKCREIAIQHGTDAEGEGEPEFGRYLAAEAAAMQCERAVRGGKRDE